MHEGSHGRDVNAFVARRGRVKTIAGHSFSDRIPVIVVNVLDGGIRVLETGPGKVPMKVRVREID
jgi:hypothetical protein